MAIARLWTAQYPGAKHVKTRQAFKLLAFLKQNKRKLHSWLAKLQKAYKTLERANTKPQIFTQWKISTFDFQSKDHLFTLYTWTYDHYNDISMLGFLIHVLLLGQIIYFQFFCWRVFKEPIQGTGKIAQEHANIFCVSWEESLLGFAGH